MPILRSDYSMGGKPITPQQALTRARAHQRGLVASARLKLNTYLGQQFVDPVQQVDVSMAVVTLPAWLDLVASSIDEIVDSYRDAGWSVDGPVLLPSGNDSSIYTFSTADPATGNDDE